MGLFKKNRNLTGWLTLATLTFVLWVISCVLYVFSEQQVRIADESRHRSHALVDELRQSSESLTKMARSYIVTGDPKYKQFYSDILNIRDGIIPRPVDTLFYWDLMAYGEKQTNVELESRVPLMVLAQESKLGLQEYQLLVLAKNTSDRLAVTEMKAMRYFESQGPDAVKLHALARQMLFDAAYSKSKLDIMRPLSKLNRLMEDRTEKAIHDAVFLAYVFRLVFIGTGILWVFLMWRSFVALKRILGATPGEIHAKIVRLGKGDFSPPVKPATTDSDSIMAWLGQTRLRLKDLTLAHHKIEAELEERNHYLAINNHILQLISEHKPLTEVLDGLMLTIEERHPGVMCSILLTNPEGTELLHASAPSLPKVWNDAIARVPVGDGIGSCGTAAYRGELVVVEDIREHPYWANFRDLALKQGLQACWSQPFKDSAGKVLGTFAIYHHEPASPSEKELEQISEYANLVRVAVERSLLAEELRRSEERYRLIAEYSNDVIWLADLPNLNFSYISPSIEQLRGWKPEEIVGRSLSSLVNAEMQQRIDDTLRQLVAHLSTTDNKDGHVTVEVELPHKDGHMVPVELVATLVLDEHGEPRQLLGVTRDISERKAAEETIRQMAFYDRLTGLPNRRLLEDRLLQLVAKIKRDKTRMSLLFIDLDKFKPINDQYGHEAGDWLLQQVAVRMQGCLRKSDTASRVGGDEFVVLLPDASVPEAAVLVAEKIRNELQQPFVMENGVVLQISSSIGVAMCPDHADNARDLLRFGDEAMYLAKKSGRNAVLVFEPEKIKSTQQHKQLMELVWDATYKSGQMDIDKEHEELFIKANQLLYLAFNSNAEPEKFRQAYVELLRLVEAHFAHEELILKRNNYADLEMHKEQHRILLERAYALNQSDDLTSLPIGKVVDFVAREFISEHILGFDSKYFDLFHHEGSTAASD